MHKCCLLCEDDRLWVEKEFAAIQAHNKRYNQAKSAKAKGKVGTYLQNIRPDHDALKADKIGM